MEEVNASSEGFETVGSRGRGAQGVTLIIEELDRPSLLL